jgi:hypothetical protein
MGYSVVLDSTTPFSNSITITDSPKHSCRQVQLPWAGFLNGSGKAVYEAAVHTVLTLLIIEGCLV